MWGVGEQRDGWGLVCDEGPHPLGSSIVLREMARGSLCTDRPAVTQPA
ncbi:hypothetical protein FHX44_11808 [Pseudonocardia hierapolitana]|uniref:Uncharacterized protein n=1 Tax=Pseudonocardia hierapolitana TaxID=1128676 RepID=A0A561SJC1_9PSEU|nr:hypothetical protein FHX44_11808 [Pseudonocardia hierapolitana]